MQQKLYKDLFEDYNNIPLEIRSILKLEDGKLWDCPTYVQLSEMQYQIECKGYTFDFGLDGTAYGLRPIHIKIEEIEGF